MRLFLRSLLFLTSAFGAGQHASGEAFSSYPQQKISLRGITDIKIVGVKGALKLRGRPHAKFLGLKVQHSGGARFADWHLSVDRRGSTIFLEVFNVAYGAQWKTQVRSELWPEFNIELEGPALPTAVGWREGRLDIINWDADVEMSFLKGRARVVGGHGQLLLEPVQANVDIQGHRGKVSIKGDSGEVVLTRNEGELNLNWLSGDLQVVDCRGKMKIESADSQVIVQGGQGELDLRLSKGRAQILAFEGLVQGQGEQAKWDVSAAAPSDLNFTTSSGPVDVHWKAGGARVFLTSTGGSIRFPGSAFLREADRDGKKIVQGLKSAKSMGQVFVRTDSGAILCCQ